MDPFDRMVCDTFARLAWMVLRIEHPPSFAVSVSVDRRPVHRRSERGS